MGLKEALYYHKLSDNKVQCVLCPQNCLITSGNFGFCGARKNIEGRLFSLIYNRTTGVALDPVEKKPLYHFHPGEYILSLGTKGCNFACPFCQNWHISQNREAMVQEITSTEAVRQALSCGSFGLAYTYNEPFIWFEFVLETAVLARENGLCNVLVTNGYVNPEPLEELLPYIDAMNIDIKSIREDFYKKICHAKLSPVLATARRAKQSAHIEITNLVIPELNDREEDFADLVDWIHDNLGPDTPLHFSRYFPAYKMRLPPTPQDTLEKAYNIAVKKLKRVYLGNV